MSASTDSERILIVGAGLAGSLLAILLGKTGRQVILCERRGDPRLRGYGGGRSINLALSARGISGLAAAGLDASVLADAIPMRGRMMHSPAGALTFQAYSANKGDCINSVSRGALNLSLISAAAELPNVELRFNHRCDDVDFDAPAATFFDEDTGETHRVVADAIIGADGAFSAVRAKMLKLDRFSYSQSFLDHGYKELTIPPTASGEYALDPNALHIWPRGGSMMIALPNKDRSFTCTLFWPFDGDHSFGAIPSQAEILPFFQRHYPDAVPLMPTLIEDYQRNPTSALVTVRCRPWRMGGKVALLGDAAHAIVPFYGQGMNCAFEDCTALVDCLREHPTDRAAAFEAYETRRRENADAIADMALDNFIEMRDKVGSRAFLARKKFEHLLHKLFPGAFVPLYNLVSFSLTPYAEARRRAALQWGWVWAIGAAVAYLVLLLIGLMTGAVRTNPTVWILLALICAAVIWLKGPWRLAHTSHDSA